MMSCSKKNPQSFWGQKTRGCLVLWKGEGYILVIFNNSLCCCIYPFENEELHCFSKQKFQGFLQENVLEKLFIK